MTTTSETPLWTPRAVAASLGVSVTTLRTWDSRYRLGPSARSAGRHRRYSDQDVDRLRRMLDLTAAGMSAGAAAAAALAGDHDQDQDTSAASASPKALGASAVQGMVESAARLDSPRLTELADRAVARFGVVASWQRLFQPVLAEVGERIARGTLGVEVEHLVSAAVIHALGQVPVPASRGRIRALLAAAPEELHNLPLHALGAALAERRCPHRNLGARVPAESLLATVRRLRPRAVVVWAHTPVSATMVPMTALLAEPVDVVVAGPGWPAGLPDAVRVVTSLEDGLAVLLGDTAAIR